MKIKKTEDLRYIYQYKLDKTSFQHEWFMLILKICEEEHLLIKYSIIQNLLLLKIQRMINTKEVSNF